jgi:hypothetical protein
MTVPYYIEDIFVEFIDIVIYRGNISMQYQDTSAAHSFYQTIAAGGRFTQNQANYVLKILHKYRKSAKPFLDYEDRLTAPQWKQPFRVLDIAKKVWVELDDEKFPWVCLKFPFVVKEEFDNEHLTWTHKGSAALWDKELKCRKLKLYDYNLMQVYDFVNKHNFEIDDSFMEAIAEIEEIWNDPDDYLKGSSIVNDKVVLINCNEDANEYFEREKTNDVNKDLMLAKRMGYSYQLKPTSTIEKIAASPSNSFWVKTQREFLELAYRVGGKVVIIVDRSESSINWIKQLAETIEACNYDRKDFRICFRSSSKIDSDFNKWVSDNHFGGKIEHAKFLIFQYKVAKWLFKEQNDVTILASNDIVPSTSSTTRAMFSHHPCVLYVGDIKPTSIKDAIIEL